MVTIIGAGLSGLGVAYRLQKVGIPYTVLEAGAVVGGRVQSAFDEHGHQDLGPSWVWPYAQPVVEEWLDELKLKTFAQYDQGDGLIDRASDTNAISQFIPGQQGIERIVGGTHAIVRSLLAELTNVHCHHELVSCSIADDGIDLKVKGAATALNSDQLVIATPPRLAVPLIKDTPELNKLASLLEQTPTWMAPHAKVVIFYEQAFWRERGLSGRVASSVGPLAEIHDHCGPDGNPAALFGFVGVPAIQRADAQDQLLEAIKQQLLRCFGADAPAPQQIIIKDWAFEKYISTEADITGPGAHPAVIDESVRKSWCDNRLWFAAAETAPFSPGLIEGALARADQVAEQIVKLH